MDLIPIQAINNLIKPTTGAANDGGSKSQSGYVNVRTGQPEKGDELTISDESKRLIGEDPVVDDKSFLDAIKNFFRSIFQFIKKIFNFRIKFPEKKQEPEKVEASEENHVKNFLGYTRHTN